ncbi:MAG: glycogen synthase GlgA [Parcubacteria group bacterium Athens1014_10]|nr:MAG: glycogen synthase GlgA [Parcubacteria group bacterium Athens1014_10]TSD05444.1 MAG: glycogen synthase GlgA [Parcubacteria group bacterium Athens0714_12]
MPKQIKIVSISSEISPFSKTGGLADVASALPKALTKLGHKAIAATPLYAAIDKEEFELEKIASNIKLTIDKTTKIKINFWLNKKLLNFPVYFIESPDFFSNGANGIYKTKYENQKFLVFDLACFKLLEHLNFKPDIIHCHDWHTGLIPQFLKERHKKDSLFKNTKTIFTIHNLIFQLGSNWWEFPENERDSGHATLPFFNEKDKIEKINFTKRAIIHSDIINTVSEEYAREILEENNGQGLSKSLQARKYKLFGVINGIDQKEFNPATDPGLIQKYSVDSLDNKNKNKIYLQKWFKLEEDSHVPLMGMVSRIAEQKGFDLIIEIIDQLLHLDVQLVLLGAGEKRYEKFFRKISQRHSKKIAALLEFNTIDATKIYAGCDIFLMPSRFEPCGLGQLISLRYGAVPVVHGTGGLFDTITDFNPKTDKGNGFVAKTYDAKDFLVAITRALETYKYPEVWNKLVRRGMRKSYSWEIPAKKYVLLYRRILRHHEQN